MSIVSPCPSRLTAGALALVALAMCSGLSADISTYAGQEQRELKAMSAAQVQDHLTGQGMGLARVAELNGYPGPAHVLELAQALELTPEQLDTTREIERRMRHEAVELGHQRVEAEGELERLFRAGNVDPTQLGDLLRRIGRIQADLRGAHLKAHLAQKAVLHAGQLARYNTLRGYGAAHHGHSGGHAH